MVEALIRACLRHRALVLLLAAGLAVGGTLALRSTPVDAIPDLSDVQVIIRTTYPGQAPGVVEDQITYPLASALLAVPRATTVRGFSFFGDSYVYVIFEEGTDLYWARSRVLEYLNQAASRLPADVQPTLGPDATGVGWVYQYALVDRTGRLDLSELRALQDWFLKLELESTPGVSEVATVGGMRRQYQVVVDPIAVLEHGLTMDSVSMAVRQANGEIGGSVVEMAEAEYMVRAGGYIASLDDLRQVAVRTSAEGVPVRLGEIAEVRFGPELRRGVADLDGEGEVVGGIIVMRFGENARKVIGAVKERLRELESGLPDGVEIIDVYDRSGLIDRSIATLKEKLTQEMLVVMAICALFLLHLRSALVIVITLPLGILAAFALMRWQGLNANIMSLGGIAIAIGAMVDAAIVMIETLHKKMEDPGYRRERHWETVTEAATEVGPALFFSLAIITFSFLPVFTLEAQEGRLFKPLAFTKTWAMAAAAVLSVTLIPVLMGYLVRGKILPEMRNPANRLLIGAYRPLTTAITAHPWLVVIVGLAALATAWVPLSRTGSEFMPELNEGDLMYMPTTHPGISADKARQLLQQTDRLIASVPEVARVFGKIGRAETATDPAPLTMIETVVQLKPRAQWRPGLTMDALRAELNQVVKLPGVTNAWVWPIKTRIDMLATGIKTPVGIKILGPELNVIQRIGGRIEDLLADVPGTASVFAERSADGRYINVIPRRDELARLGLSVADVHKQVRHAVGGMRIAETLEGRERYSINLRYPRDWRDSLEALAELPFVTSMGHKVQLGEVADVTFATGAPMIKSENARPTGWVFVDVTGRDLGGYVDAAKAIIEDQLDLPPGYSLKWSGQYEYLERARARLLIVAPLTIVIIALLLYAQFRRMGDVIMLLATLPMALVGGAWLLYALDYDFSVAVGVGYIALAGVAVETGVVMLVYLRNAWQSRLMRLQAEDQAPTRADLVAAVEAGSLMRVRPLMMTVSTIFIGLLPVMFGEGTGSEVMKRIAAPMVGGMVSATLLTLAVIPAVFYIRERARLNRQAHRS